MCSNFITHLKKNFTFFQKAFNISIVIITFFVIFFIAWASNKGFDITDEGFYLLASQHPQQMQIWPDVFYVYTSILYHLVLNNIVLFRLTGLTLLLISSYVFFQGWSHLFDSFNFKTHLASRKNTMLALVTLGALLYYTLFLLTPSYNLLNSFALTSAFGFLCSSLAHIQKKLIRSKNCLINLFLSGLLIGFCLLIKFPTAFLLIVLFTTALILWPNVTVKQRLMCVGTLWFGASLWICLHLFLLQPFPVLDRTIRGGIQYVHANGTGHTVLECLHNYFNDLTLLMINVLKSFWKLYAILLIAFIVAFFLQKKWNKKNLWLNPLLLIIFLAMAVKSYKAKLLFSGTYAAVAYLMQFYAAWLFLLIVTLVLSAYYNKNLIRPIIKNNKLRFSILTILLLSLPFIGAVGTNNPITQNAMMCMVSWLALLETLLVLLAYLQNNQWIYWAGTLIIAIFASSQIISASLHPYRLNADIFKQDTPTNIGVPATSLKLDVATSNFFNLIQKIAISHGFKPGDDILAFTDMPGIVYALGGKSPVIAGFTSSRNAVNIDTQLMELMQTNRLKQAFILENGRFGFPELVKFGIKFPQDYILCGQAVWPFTNETIRLWKLRLLNEKY
jgi:hypothetical protein